jgi:hypothetical protein
MMSPRLDRHPLLWHVIVVALCCALCGCGSETPAGPSATDLTGNWSGTSTYPNAPFQFRLRQTGDTIRGDYADRHDSSIAAGGTLTGTSLTMVVDFGDAKLHFTATVVDAHTVQGDMFTSALGNRLYPFTMTR